MPYFNVCDGHGGIFVARYLRSRLKEKVKSILENVISERGDIKDEEDLKEIKKAMKLGFKDLNDSLRTNYPYQSHNCGSTAIVAFIYKQFLFVFNVGDSRAVMRVDNEVWDLSEDAKLTVEKFAKGVRNNGGEILPDEDGVLRAGHINIARSFGDFSSPGIIAIPKMEGVDLSSLEPGATKDLLLILACDGIWDVLSSEQAINFVDRMLASGKTSTEATVELIKKALDKGSSDNCTAMIITRTDAA